MVVVSISFLHAEYLLFLNCTHSIYSWLCYRIHIFYIIEIYTVAGYVIECPTLADYVIDSLLLLCILLLVCHRIPYYCFYVIEFHVVVVYVIEILTVAGYVIEFHTSAML